MNHICILYLYEGYSDFPSHSFLSVEYLQNFQLYFLLGTVTVDVEEDEVAGVTIEDEVVLVAIEDEVAGGAIEDEVVLGAIVDGGGGGGGISEDETFADGAGLFS